MSVQPYEIDPAWPVVRHTAGDEVDDSSLEVCEVCNARTATKVVELFGVEGWACDYCR